MGIQIIKVLLYIYKEFFVGGSKVKTVLYFHIAREVWTVLYYPFIEQDTRMAKNRKTFKRFYLALSAMDS